MTSTTREFGKWRSRLWPVHHFELKKLIPMVLLFFFILFNYTILRDTKDTLVVTAADGSQVIPFLKLWAVLPCAILFMLIYARLSNKLSKPVLFYSTVIPFIAFFGLFGTVLYPLRESLHPHEFSDWLQATLPAGAKGLVDVIRNWTFSLFYVMSELWGSMAISLLFWGFANDINKVSESRRFYTIFSMFANISLIISGTFIQWAANIREKITAADPWQVTLNYTMSMVVIAGLLVIGIYWWINKYVLTDKRLYDQSEQKTAKKSKPKLSMKESFMYLVRSKYLGCIAILVMAYGISINLVEVTWKDQLHHQYPDYNDYQAFMGGFSTKTGIITIFVTFFLGGNIVRRFGWGKTALITPIMLMVTGVAFFSFIIFGGSLQAMIQALGSTPLMLAVIFGTIQNIASKSSKYSFFDPTKEMAYIPLGQEEKVKGKAAIDVVGARLGKSGGSLIQQGLFLALNTAVVGVIAPYVAVVLFGIIFAWVIAARSLNKQFLNLSAKREEEKVLQERKEKQVEDAEPAAKLEAPAEPASTT
ncbi:MAG: NTP/NDP exchange transporter [Candidatus Neptunochlamydia sp.]|nr:NTP/NDP exchange transporter [Candidatus Neptunochlamydia sp.]